VSCLGGQHIGPATLTAIGAQLRYWDIAVNVLMAGEAEVMGKLCQAHGGHSFLHGRGIVLIVLDTVNNTHTVNHIAQKSAQNMNNAIML
jgi:hypothetical protein